jgi:hypothetical protein
MREGDQDAADAARVVDGDLDAFEVVTAASGSMLLLRHLPELATLSAPLAFLGSVAPELGYAVAGVVLSFGIVSFRKLESTV